jgi:hypothetical protein
MEWELSAGGWAPATPRASELTDEYQVLDVSFEILVGRAWRQPKQDETRLCLLGTLHTFRVGTVCVRNVHRPALDFEPYIKELSRIANEGKPRRSQRLRLTCQHHEAGQRLSHHSRAAAWMPKAAVAHTERWGGYSGSKTV